MSNELKAQYRAKLDEARALTARYKDGPMPAEEAKKVEAILGQADELKVQIDLGNRLAAGDAYMNEPAGTKAAHHGWRDAAPDEGNVPTDEKSWREYEYKNAYGGSVKVRYNVPLAVQKKGYAGAFESYIRRGKGSMGPNDLKTLSEGVDNAGGFLVPEDYHVELIKKIATMATVRQNARVVQTSRDAAKWPRVNYTTDDEYTSGVRLTWTGETPSSATVHRVTDPVFGTIDIPVHTAMASMPMTNVLLEDSAFDVAGISSDLLGEAFALGENDAFINGSGISRPMGILTQVDGDGPDSIVSGAANAISTSGDAHTGYRLVKLYYTLPAQYRNRAIWMMTSLTGLEVDSLVDTTGRPLIRELNSVSLGSGEPSIIKGRPIVFDEFMPEITTDGYPILFGDFSGYIVLDRVGLSIKRLDELYAETDITLLLARKRVGGYLAEPWRVKVLKASAS